MKSPHAALVLALFLLCLAVPAFAAREERAPAPPSVVPTSPKSAVRELARAYTARSVEGLAALYSADYRFHFSAGDSAGAGYLRGLPRDEDLASAVAMLRSYTSPEGVTVPGVKRVRITAGPLEEGADPEHPDSLLHYRVVVANHFEFDIVAYDTLQTRPSTQIFYLVRGDVAQLAPGQRASANRWYIRRWLEDVRAVEQALAATDGRCEENEALAAAPLAGVFGVRALNTPLCPTLEVVCDLPRAEPATLEVYDLQGRRLARQELRPTQPGPMRLLAGGGRHFAPGAYWLRLLQAGQAPSKRMVIVAR